MIYKFTFEDGSSECLAHFGVKGMKWGVWNDDTKQRYYKIGYRQWGARKLDGYSNQGGVIPKGTTLYRTSTHKDDPASGNRLYVSTSKTSHKNWRDYMGYAYRNKPVYSVQYKAASDLKVMPERELGEMYVNKMLHNKSFQKQSLKDLSNIWGEKITVDQRRAMLPDEHLFYNTKTSSALYKEARKRGYQVIGDRKGQWLDRDPLIVMDADKNLTGKRVRRTFTNMERGYDFKRSEHTAKAYNLQIRKT